MDVEQLESNHVNSLLRKAAAELESNVRSGDTRATEAVLTTYPELAADREAILELIYTEYVLRQEQGAEVQLAEWEARFPQWTKDLRELFQVHEFLSDDDALGGSRRKSQDIGAARLGRIGNFELLEELGRGGMGIVYRARQIGLDRLVAVKTVLGYASSERRVIDRFRTEAEAFARLQHPHIVQIYEVGNEDGTPYFSMEFVSGGNLAGFIRERPLRPITSAQLIESLARAVHYAHTQGIVHRDLKPENILLAPSSRSEAIYLGDAAAGDTIGGSGVTGYYEPKITDFGLAKRTDSDEHQTVDGAALGTPGYMSPEQTQIESSKIGPTSDVYALGAVLYDMLVGRPPFHAATALETIDQVRSKDPIPPRNIQPAVPRDLETICLKCLQKQPERRFLSAAEVADDLRRFLNGEPIRARTASVGEKLRKWARRHPSITALFVAVAIGIVGIASQWMRAEVNRAAAERETAAANQARQAEQMEHQRAIGAQYAHDVQLARLKYETNNTAQALQLLNACPEGLRHWEWYFVRSQCQEARFSFPSMSKFIHEVDWSPDGRLLAAVTGMWGVNEPGWLNVWETDTGRLRFSVEAHAGGVLTVQFSRDGTRIVTAGVMWQSLPAASGVKVWDVNNGHELLTLADTHAFSARFSPDDRMLAIGRSTGAIGLHDSVSGEEIAVLKGHGLFASDLAFRPDGKFLASAGRDGTLRVWDLESYMQFAIVERLRDVRHVAYLPDGKEILAGTFDGVLKRYRQRDDGLHEMATMTRATSMPGLGVAPDGQTLAISAVNRPTMLLDIKSEVPIRELPGHNGFANAASFSPDGRRIATGGADGVVTIWDWIEPTQPQRTDLSGPHIADIAFHPDGHQIALASGLNAGVSRERVLRLWDVRSGRVTSVLSGHTDWLTSVAYHPLGLSIITGSDDKTVRLWDCKTGELVRTIEGHRDAVTSVAFVGEEIASASRDGTIRLWNAASGEETNKLLHEEQPVLAMAAQRGGLLSSVTADGSLWIWHAPTGEQRARIAGTSSNSARLAFSSDGSLLAVASDQPIIDLWNVAKVLDHHGPKKRGSIADCKLELVGHTSAVTGIAFSPDGKRLASTSNDRHIKIWDVVRGTEVLSLAGQLNTNSKVAFSPDGRQLVQSGYSNLFVWETELTKSAATSMPMLESASSEQLDAQSARARDWHYSECQRAEGNHEWHAAAFHRTQLQEIELDEPEHLAKRGVAYAEMGRLDKALDDWDNCFDSFTQPNDLIEWSYRRAIVRLLHDDAAIYRQICRQLWDKYSSTASIDQANRIAWLCCLGPDSGVSADDYVKLAQRGATDMRVPGRLNTLGACLYRAQRYEEAIGTLNLSMMLQGRGGLPHDWAFLALSHAAVGDVETSREYLEKTTAWLTEQKQRADNEEPVDPVYSWNNRIELELFLREARNWLAAHVHEN